MDANCSSVEGMGVSWRCVTHVMQRTRHATHIKNDFREYVSNQARMLGVAPDSIFNADDTNVYYSVESCCTHVPTEVLEP